MKLIEDREPNKLRAKIYKLKYEQKKLEQAQEKLKNQKLVCLLVRIRIEPR